MIHIESHIKRKFKPSYFPPNVCWDSKCLNNQFSNINLNYKEELVMAIDNEPLCEKIDSVIFTSSRIIILSEEHIKSIFWDQIEAYQLPKEKKIKNYVDSDNKMERNDQAKIYTKHGEIVSIRIICGGIYQLATLLSNLNINLLPTTFEM